MATRIEFPSDTNLTLFLQAYNDLGAGHEAELLEGGIIEFAIDLDELPDPVTDLAQDLGGVIEEV